MNENQAKFVFVTGIVVCGMIIGSALTSYYFLHYSKEPVVPENNGLAFYTFSASIPQSEIDKVVKASNQAWFCERHNAITNWCIAGNNGSIKTLTLNSLGSD